MFIKEISVEQRAAPGVAHCEIVIWTTLDEACPQINYCT